MKKLIKSLSMLLLLMAGTLTAHIHPAAGCFGIDVEYLYLFPSVDDTYFAIQGTTINAPNPNGTRINNDLGFNSGFRVGGIYAFCDCNQAFSIYYTRLRTTRTKTLTSGSLWATIGSPSFASVFQDYTGSASSRLDFLYQRVDGFFSHQAYCYCGINLYLLAGVEYAHTRLLEDYRYDVTSLLITGNLHHKWRNNGFGPQFGVDFDYDLCNFSECFCPGSLSLTAFTSGSILATKTKQNEYSIRTDTSVTANVSDHHTWRVVPALHARVGLNYATCFSCFGASLEIGYEFNTYIRNRSNISFVDDVATGRCNTEYFNTDLQGLYIALDAMF